VAGAAEGVAPSPPSVDGEGRRSLRSRKARGLALVRESPVPLHFQLRNLLVAMIESGELPSGEALPPERELAAEFGVSLAPVRQAILDLVKEGVVYRVRGKGTFLRERPQLVQDSILTSFTENMRAKGLEVEMRVLREELVAPAQPVARALRTSERRVFSVERLAIVDGEPMALITSFLSARRFRGLGRKLRGGQSLYRVIEDEYGAVPMRADLTVEVTPVTTAQSALLELAAGSSVLVAAGTTYDADDAPVEHFHVVYRADRIRLRLDTHRYSENVITDSRRVRRSSSR
jgi:GntR family transcriptional regulator